MSACPCRQSARAPPRRSRPHGHGNRSPNAASEMRFSPIGQETRCSHRPCSCSGLSIGTKLPKHSLEINKNNPERDHYDVENGTKRFPSLRPESPPLRNVCASQSEPRNDLRASISFHKSRLQPFPAHLRLVGSCFHKSTTSPLHWLSGGFALCGFANTDFSSCGDGSLWCAHVFPVSSPPTRCQHVHPATTVSRKVLGSEMDENTHLFSAAHTFCTEKM